MKNGSDGTGKIPAIEMTADSDHAAVMEDLLDRWEEARENGRTISPEELCGSYPDLLPEVRRRIGQLVAIDDRIGKGLESQHLAGTKLPVQTSIEELEFLQRGGLGAVYVGEDMSAHRRVAVKFLHDHLASDPMCRERFLLEAEVTARLEHPGVIPLYGIGENEKGDPFYAMRFIDGHSMDELIDRLHDRDDPESTKPVEQDRRYRKLLNDFVSVCKTIAYAHNRGIVHRDIKPANVMLGKYGETIVVDWGLAVPVIRDEPFRQSGEKTLMPAQTGDSSTSGHGAGTPVYMSPEQASKLAPTPASDIYSLGATLYKILCGKTAVDGSSVVEIKEKVIDGRITPIREVRPEVPAALAAIAQKAMASRPNRRYATALELADDVEAFLADESVTAHQEKWHARLLRMARRNRSATRTAVIAVIVGAVLGTFAFLTLGAYATRETLMRKDAQVAQEQAQLAQEQAREAQARAEQLRDESLAASAQFLAKSIGNEIDLRWRILEAEASSARLRELMLALRDAGTKTPRDESRDDDAVDLSAMPESAALQAWLQTRYINNREAVKTDSWFAQAEDGTQLARVPWGESIGRNYAHRDYFNGIGYDLLPEDVAAMSDPPGPLADRVVHMSAVYESTNTRTLKVTFSVPVYDAERNQSNPKKIGVIGMSVELGDFAMDPTTWLIDTRTDQIDHQRGLLLQHPELGQRSGDDELFHVSADLVAEILELRRERLRSEPLTVKGVTRTIADPVDGSSRKVAIEPVVIRGRPAAIADTGWIVVVAE